MRIVQGLALAPSSTDSKLANGLQMASIIRATVQIESLGVGSYDTLVPLVLPRTVARSCVLPLVHASLLHQSCN
jgi:hypothetical protein